MDIAVNDEELLKLIRFFCSFKEGFITLDEYVKNMIPN